MELFFTDIAILRVEGTTPVLREAVRDMVRLSIPDGMPFVIRGDGSYDAELNRFFRDLPAMGCRSSHTWRAYARDIVTFARFLDEQCDRRTLLSTSMDDIRLYYRTRRLVGSKSVDATTWNRSVAALDKFYRWAHEQGLVATPPFTYESVSRHLPGYDAARTVERNHAFEKAGGGETVRCVSFEDYIAFRNVGLMGLTPDGSIDPAFRGRNRLRNAAFAELLVTTGIRLEEAGSILRSELPDHEASTWHGFRSCKMRLSRPTTKGDKGRTIWLPKRLLKDYIHPYIVEERENAVLRAGETETSADAPVVVSTFAGGCVVRHSDGSRKKVSYDSLRPSERRHLLMEHGGAREPAMLWLTEAGQPTTLNNLETMFARACARCAAFGISLSVTPHVLRHTFAVYMLSHLIKGVIEEGGDRRGRSGEGVYRRVVADPLRTLQRMLGHASIATTYRYLTYIEEAEELVDAAVGSWGDRLGGIADGLDPEGAT